MGQEQYNEWVQRTNIREQDMLCGGNRISINEKYFIDKYAKENILDVGCGTGHRTFPEWTRRNLIFYGLDKFQNLKDESTFSDKIILSDISGDNFQDTIKQIPIKTFNIAVLLGGVINGMFDRQIHEKTWGNFNLLLGKCDYILIDTLTHFNWYLTAEYGQEDQLYHKIPTQYFFSKNELERLNNRFGLEFFEEKTEKIESLERTHYLLKKKKK